MKHEFKVTKSKEQTVYTLESASSGGTSSGSVASVSTALGGVQRRPTDSIFAQEAKKEEPKPRNFVAKNAKMGGAGKMKDKSKTIPRHEKHKKPVAEGAPELLKKEMPLHRHAEKLLAQNGVSKDDPDYYHHLGNTIKHLRQFGNIDLINKQGVAEGLVKDIKRLATGKDVKSRAGQEIAKSQDASMKGDNKTSKKHFDRYDKLDKLANKEHGVAEGVAETVPMQYAQKVLNHYGADYFKTTHDTLYFSKYRKQFSIGRIRDDDSASAGSVNLSDLNSMVRKLRDMRVPLSPFGEGVGEDHEIQMASSELQSIAKNAVHLLDLVRKYSEQEGLQAWQQSKITKAADYLNSVLQSVSGEQSGMEEARNNYHANTTGFSRGPRDDERHDLDPSDWYIVKDGKMYKTSVYPRQEQEALSRGYSRTREEANAKANNVEEDDYMMELAGKLAEKIPPNADVDYYINDFSKSTAPQFKGKNPAKRKQMAIAAYYGSKQKKK